MYGLSVIWPTASVQDEARRGLAQLRRILLPHALGHARGEGVQRVAAWGATVRGTYPTPEAGTRTQYVLYVGPWGRAALCVRYVPNAGGWYA